MTTEIATAPRASLLEAMALKYNLEPTKFLATVKATIFDAKGTQEELIAFLTVANRYNLDPFCGEVFAFRKQGGGIQAVVGVDGWSSILNSHPQMDGMEFTDHLNDAGDLLAVTCKLYRKDRSHPVTCTEYMKECKRNTQPWTQWPRRMLRHKATIQCARLAFGLTGIIDPDEADRYEQAGSSQAGSKVQTSKLNQLLDTMPAGNSKTPSNGSKAEAAPSKPSTPPAPQMSTQTNSDGVDEPAVDEPDVYDQLAQTKAAIVERYEACESEKEARAVYDQLCGPDSDHEEQIRNFASLCFDVWKENHRPKPAKKKAAQKSMLEDAPAESYYSEGG